MPLYVDGFVLPLPRKNVAAYRRLARQASRVWRDHGALEYRECIGDDLAIKGVVTFPKQIRTRAGETVVLAWIVYRSRAHRDKVNAAVMKDPRIVAMMQRMRERKAMPFDDKRMVYGGFRVLVEA